MKKITKIYLIAFLFAAVPLMAMDGVAVIDMRTAVLSTQAAADAFKALEEDADYCLLYTSPSPRDDATSRMPSSA